MRDAGRGAAPRGNDDWIERVRAASDIVEVIGSGAFSSFATRSKSASTARGNKSCCLR